jgi:hypothetical protein
LMPESPVHAALLPESVVQRSIMWQPEHLPKTFPPINRGGKSEAQEGTLSHYEGVP